MAKSLSLKEEIARLRARKSVEDRVYEALDQFDEVELEAVKKVVLDLFQIKTPAAAVVEEAPKKEFKFAPAAPADTPKVKTRGRKPGSKKKNKVKAVAAEPVVEKKSSGRGRKGKYSTIHEDKVRDAVIDILKAHDGSLSQKEIREYLCQGAYAEHRENKAFQSRISSLLGRWCDEGILSKPERGIYELKQR